MFRCAEATESWRNVLLALEKPTRGNKEDYCNPPKKDRKPSCNWADLSTSKYLPWCSNSSTKIPQASAKCSHRIQHGLFTYDQFFTDSTNLQNSKEQEGQHTNNDNQLPLLCGLNGCGNNIEALVRIHNLHHLNRPTWWLFSTSCSVKKMPAKIAIESDENRENKTVNIKNYTLKLTYSPGKWWLGDYLLFMEAYSQRLC